MVGESLDPRTRWRWRLLADGLRPESAPGAVAVEAFESEVVEAYARQIEARWRAALGLLWQADPELAGRLKRRLAAVVNFGNGEWAPAWPTDLADLDLLASSLAGADTRPAARASRAEAWLQHQPAAYAWVADDGSTLDAARAKVLAELRVASVFDRATLAWVTPDPAPDGASPELHDVAPMTVRALLAAPPPDVARSAARYTLHVGRWEGSLASCTRPLGVEPPGFTMTPFLADWTMAAWEAARPEAAAWTTAAMLHRPALPPGEEPSNARSRFWELYVECATVAGEGEQGREQIKLYVGPRERPVAVMRVSASGELVYLPVADKLSSAPELLPSPTTVPVLRGAGRWSFRVSLPPGAVEKDGIVRLGLVRTDALGRRSTWPRPLLPWESDPGRAALDTRAWQALTEPKE